MYFFGVFEIKLKTQRDNKIYNVLNKNKNNMEKNVKTKDVLRKNYDSKDLVCLKNLMSYLKTDFMTDDGFAQWMNHTNHIKTW